MKTKYINDVPSDRVHNIGKPLYYKHSCKRCGLGRLRWRDGSKAGFGWRLYDQNNILHRCY